MEPTLYKYIKKYSWRQQLYLLILTLASFPFLYASLDLPKTIVNKAIGSTQFPRTELGLTLSQTQYLAVLCFVFLALVAINGGFKYFINVFKGQVGERMLRRLRYQLFGRILRFPLPHFRRTSQGELIAMITSEVESLGGFIGDAFAQPLFQGGTLITILAFMFAQDWKLGLAAIALYPFQAYIIPKLQRQVNLLAKERVRTVRRLSERIGEAVTAIEDIHANDTSEFHRADFARWVGVIYEIRFKIYNKKFFIKFLNNFIAQLTPFFFYSIGGYLVIRGDLSFGALVAVLTAYKDLSSPWKELLDWYQQKEDARIKYEQLVEQFDLPGMLDETLQAAEPGTVSHLSGPVTAVNLALTDETGVKVVDGANFKFDINQRVALAGGSGSGVDAVAKLVTRLVMPTGGTLLFGSDSANTLPEAVTGRRIGYVGPSVALMHGSLRDNLLYGLKRRPVRPKDRNEKELRIRERAVLEAQKSGNTESAIDDDWIDYEALGIADKSGLGDRVVDVLRQVRLEQDVFSFGLKGTINPSKVPEVAEGTLSARHQLRGRLSGAPYRGLLEPFESDRYNYNMTVAENILFGLPVGPTFDLENIADHPYMRSVLDRVGITEDFLAGGLQVGRVMIDLFSDLPPGHPFFERFSFIHADALPAIEAAVRRVETNGLGRIEPAERNLLMSLPFKLIPARHRLGFVDDRMVGRLLDARRVFAAELPEDLNSTVAFFDPDAFNTEASIQENILFGKLVYGRSQDQKALADLMAEVIDQLGLRRSLVEIGMEYEVGIGGSRLSAAQRQQVGLARTLLKRPDLIVLDQATAALDAGTAADIHRLLVEKNHDAGLVWVRSSAEKIDGFDHVFVMEQGRTANRLSPSESSKEPQTIAAPA